MFEFRSLNQCQQSLCNACNLSFNILRYHWKKVFFRNKDACTDSLHRVSDRVIAGLVVYPNQSDGDTVLVTKKSVVDKKRVARKKGLGLSTTSTLWSWSSLWTTLASSTFEENDDGRFVCAICAYISKTNKSHSIGNIIKHYKTMHDSVRLRLAILNNNHVM